MVLTFRGDLTMATLLSRLNLSSLRTLKAAITDRRDLARGWSSSAVTAPTTLTSAPAPSVICSPSLPSTSPAPTPSITSALAWSQGVPVSGTDRTHPVSTRHLNEAASHTRTAVGRRASLALVLAIRRVPSLGIMVDTVPSPRSAAHTRPAPLHAIRARATESAAVLARGECEPNRTCKVIQHASFVQKCTSNRSPVAPSPVSTPRRLRSRAVLEELCAAACLDRRQHGRATEGGTCVHPYRHFRSLTDFALPPTHTFSYLRALRSPRCRCPSSESTHDARCVLLCACAPLRSDPAHLARPVGDEESISQTHTSAAPPREVEVEVLALFVYLEAGASTRDGNAGYRPGQREWKVRQRQRGAGIETG
ncbi:hypothetical protein B0H13DRAFT_2488761 [Mycena leptocephala]|nr:hypothetical protein B0H13DRAFT_2488761 [Mycena leptocephala]